MHRWTYMHMCTHTGLQGVLIPLFSVLKLPSFFFSRLLPGLHFFLFDLYFYLGELFMRQVSPYILGLPQTCNPPASASPNARITNLGHHSWLRSVIFVCDLIVFSFFLIIMEISWGECCIAFYWASQKHQ